MQLKKYIWSCSFIAALTLFASCTDDELKVKGDEEPGIESQAGYSLSFRVGLQSLGFGTRADDVANGLIDGAVTPDVEKYEDYVDAEKLYVMFFLYDETHSNDDLAHGQDKLLTMFEPGDKAVSLIPVGFQTTDGYDKSWYVKISIPDVDHLDGNNNKLDGETFAQILRENDFRIAVIANAESNKKIVLNPAVVTKNASGTVTVDLTSASSIHDIHRQTDGNDLYVKDEYTKKIDPDTGDTSYEVKKSDATRRHIYGFLYNNMTDAPGKYLGYYTGWVSSNIQDIKENTAVDFIRDTFNPSVDEPYLDYKDLWSVWNFGGGDDNRYVSYPQHDINYSNQWKTRNGAYLTSLLDAALENDPANLSSFSTGPEIKVNGQVVSKENVYLRYMDFVEDNVHATAVYDDVYGYGVKLPKNQHGAGTTTTGNKYEKLDTIHGGWFSFMAHGTGHLHITASNGGSGTAVIYAQTGAKDTKEKFEFKSPEPTTIPSSSKIAVTGNSINLYIYTDAASGSEPVIYQIEYVQDQYLYETDRRGIAPSKTQPIPMYGVASYAKLENLWAPGTSFDLDDYHGTSPDDPTIPDPYTYFHPIPLLRSVAKVIVKIPRALSSHHVYLRSMNRNGRWEPADVRSNTLDIWNDGSEDFTGQHSKKCEFFNIIKQKPFYDPTNTTNKDKDGQWAEYKTKLAWYYGNWAKQGLIEKNTPMVGTEDTSNDFEYPHIMNALITRSDFVKFFKVGTEDIYDKYVLYVPEKYVDDPNNLDDSSGIERSTPKVCHIEFRVEGDGFRNLDDNNCYRIYFTDYGFNPAKKIPDQSDDSNGWEQSYEQDPANLNVHWPIIRNHVYQFTVQDVSSSAIIVALEVLPWKKVKEIEVNW